MCNLVGSKNLVAEVLIFVFALISFVIYAMSVLKNESALVYLSVFCYIMPQFIRIVNEFSKEYMSPFLAKLSVVLIVAGILVIVATIVCMSSGLKSYILINYILVIASSIFMVHSAYKLKIEIQKHLNIHKSINESMEV